MQPTKSEAHSVQRAHTKWSAYNRGPEQVDKSYKDAIAILDELAIQYPPAVIIAESAKMQREEAGDGVATFVVFLVSAC